MLTIEGHILAGLLSYYPYVKNQEIHIVGPWKILQE